MELVKQPTSKSKQCGQCCLATVSGKPLEEITKLVGHTHGTKTTELVKCLKQLGFTPDTKLRIIGKDKLIPSFCILKVKYKYKSSWHWVVFRDKKIYDPSVGIFEPKDFHKHYSKNTKITSYLDIDKITYMEALARSIDREGLELMRRAAEGI